VYFVVDWQPDVVDALPEGKRKRLHRWHRDRESIYSPFAALHRVGERVYESFNDAGGADNREIQFMSRLNEEIDEIVDKAAKTYGQDLITGLVDTAAGRNGALHGWGSDTFGDLFAKYLFPDEKGKTGRIGYRVDHAPAEFEEEVEKIHFLLSELLPRARKYFYTADQEAAKGVNDYADYEDDYNASNKLKFEFMRAIKQWIKDPQNKPHPMSLKVPPPEPSKQSHAGRRAREAAKQNPLVDYIKDTNLSSKESWAPYAPLLQANAKDVFTRAYAKTKPSFIVYIGAATRSQLETLAVEQNAVVLYLRERSREEKTPFWYCLPSQQRGRVSREAPYTPFMLLHKLGDAILIDAYFCLPPRMDALFSSLKDIETTLNHRLREEYNKALAGKDYFKAESIHAVMTDPRTFCQGTDTEAGRMGVIQDLDQMIADLFAKYLMTGKVAYEPTKSHIPSMNLYFEEMKLFLPRIISAMLEYVKPGRVLYIGN
jgi:hypothetical protein